MRYRLSTAATVIVGAAPAVVLKPGRVSATEETAAALELLSTLGLAEPVEEEEEEETDAAEP